MNVYVCLAITTCSVVVVGEGWKKVPYFSLALSAIPMICLNAKNTNKRLRFKGRSKNWSLRFVDFPR